MLPAVSGLEVTVNVQLAFDASVLGLIGQLLLCANAPMTFTPLIVMEVDNSLVNVAVWEALVVPAGTLANDREVGENSIGPMMAGPLKGTDCGLPEPSSLNVIDSVLVPCESGRNCTETVQEAPPARVDGAVGQVVAYWTKSEPTAMEEKVNAVD